MANGFYFQPNNNRPSSRCSWSRVSLVKGAGAFLTFLAVVFLIIKSPLIRPEKPQLILSDLTIYSFNISDNPIRLNTSLEASITSRNPNSHFGLYYDSVNVYATYMGQQVTSRAKAPGTYLGHKSTDVWTMLLSGTLVPVAPYIGVALHQDWYYNELVTITIKLEGMVRWKLGAIAKGSYHLTGRCPAYLNHTDISSGINTAMKYQLWRRCDVDFSR